MKSLVVCVDYADLLAITLASNARHFDDSLVVTTPRDYATQSVAHSVPRVRTYQTDIFYKYGCAFNKGAAIEEAFDMLGWEGWICHWDADIVMPPETGSYLGHCQIGYLYTARRRICEKPAARDDRIWTRFPVPTNDDFVSGYFQLFHASDPVLRDRPRYPTHWKHAGGSDTDFCNKWPEDRKQLLPFEVLHLGPPFRNWFGRTTPYLDGSTPARAAELAGAMQLMRSQRKRHGFSLEQLPERQLPERQLPDQIEH